MIKFQKGSLTVETAMGLPVLLMVLFTWFDLSVLTYSMGVTDHALTTAVMSSKKQGSSHSTEKIDYQDVIKTKLESSGGALWSKVVDHSTVSASVYYFKNLTDFIHCNRSGKVLSECPNIKKGDTAENSVNMPIAIYQLSFTYQPLFNFVMPSMNISREMVAVQEYERCTFKLGEEISCGN
ncbi:TPA: TadE family protein [Vibrio harveyi]|uniref:Pilus assembly protein n=1 Tax=Vibrio harveyi TaxID=669 RepID=A0ABN4KWM0_VIBHA|nr:MULTISPECIES: TadE family protein [Vibrio]AMF96422.1 pilus assembly protein [Vibrio harveyi]AWB00455.1 pilus assembly protein [Vibrio harveyi]EKO3802298.1 pilus assembly protein [Vibrio harveyi]EKO3826001.1 pilus assembly protein [Vibrio harveyi]EKO3855071.1 pilus assembly protein [Vibrio harveyi]